MVRSPCSTPPGDPRGLVPTGLSVPQTVVLRRGACRDTEGRVQSPTLSARGSDVLSLHQGCVTHVVFVGCAGVNLEGIAHARSRRADGASAEGTRPSHCIGTRFVLHSTTKSEGLRTAKWIAPTLQSAANDSIDLPVAPGCSENPISGPSEPRPVDTRASLQPINNVHATDLQERNLLEWLLLLNTRITYGPMMTPGEKRTSRMVQKGGERGIDITSVFHGAGVGGGGNRKSVV